MFFGGVPGVLVGLVILYLAYVQVKKLKLQIDKQAQAINTLTELVQIIDRAVVDSLNKVDKKEFGNIKYINDPKAYGAAFNGESYEP